MTRTRNPCYDLDCARTKTTSCSRSHSGEYIARIYSSNVALQRVVVDGKPAPFVEVYPLNLLVTYNNDQPHEFRVSRSERVADVARKVAGDLAIHLDGRAPILTVAGSAQQLVPSRTLGEQDVADGAPLVLSLPNTALQTPTTPLHRNSKSTPSILLAAAAAEADGDDDDNAATTPPSVGRASAAAQTSPSTPAAGSSYSPLKSNVADAPRGIRVNDRRGHDVRQPQRKAGTCWSSEHRQHVLHELRFAVRCAHAKPDDVLS